MAMLITIVTQRFESASKFQPKQARKEVTKLQQIQKAAGLTPAQQCPNPKCGWEAVCAVGYGVEWFPCMHTIGKEEGGIPVSTAHFSVVQYPTTSI
jgi:hypothetical protein